MTLRHADGKCYGTDGDGSNGYACADGKLYGPHPTDHDQTRRYVMRCYCPCHRHEPPLTAKDNDMTTPDPRIPTPPEPSTVVRGDGASLVWGEPAPAPEPSE